MTTTRKASSEEIELAITQGITFKPQRAPKPTGGKVKTKAKKKSYITGAHGSASAKKKADIRQKRANRK